ncbi:hypothetical protein KX928_10345 [Roseobacter sp. YSTF-M11]|uniref:Uncharacterized protein n=1 Tax=Roseobacter insulae TaxID=2859783 RepID=A0A9X1FV09_9RHOB|nr:hypothetical protein [Roseobacter insulae]MBW4708183.1 hypothetical protein [Roseobacter insulae]
MSRIKTVVAAGVFFSSVAGSLQAHSDMSRAFAGCAGRFSAETEHAWLTGSDRADHLQNRRATFVSLLEATIDEGDQRRMLSYRIDAKFAHAALLQTATFGQDDDHAAAARQLADLYLLNCSRLLLDS